MVESPKSRTPNNFEKALADPLFASKLDKMSKNSLSKMMFSNDKVAAQRRKESLYDYHKIQSTSQHSQFLGQRHHMFGGPTSGHEQSMIASLHMNSAFNRTSPNPATTFD